MNVTCKFSGVFPLPSVKLTWGSFDLFADKMTAHINPSSSCYEVTIHKVGPENISFLILGVFIFSRFWRTQSCLQRRPLAVRFISQEQNTLSGILPQCSISKHTNMCHHSDFWCPQTNFSQRGGSIWPAWAEASSAIPEAFSTDWGQALMLTISVCLPQSWINILFLCFSSNF